MRQFEMVYGVMMKDFGKPQFQTISMTFGDICGTWVADNDDPVCYDNHKDDTNKLETK